MSHYLLSSTPRNLLPANRLEEITLQVLTDAVKASEEGGHKNGEKNRLLPVLLHTL